MPNIAVQIPYAARTPDANDANTAEINTIEFTATPLDFWPSRENRATRPLMQLLHYRRKPACDCNDAKVK
jgi:hypothetical protein